MGRLGRDGWESERGGGRRNEDMRKRQRYRRNGLTVADRHNDNEGGHGVTAAEVQRPNGNRGGDVDATARQRRLRLRRSQ
jgi:hypothetical protein